MLTRVAASSRSPTLTRVSPRRAGEPMSTVIVSASKVSVLTPPRVAIGSGLRGSTSAWVTRKCPRTRMPLPHISLSDPSALR